MPDFYDSMYENGFDDPEEYMDYLEAKREFQEYQEDVYSEEEDPIENEPRADAFFRYEWSPDHDEKNKDFVESIVKEAKEIAELSIENEVIPDSLIDTFCGHFEYIGWWILIDDCHKYYGILGYALAIIGLQRRDSVTSVAAAYSIIRDLAINHYVDSLPALIVLISKQRLEPQLDVARQRENYHEEIEISAPYFWRNIAYYALFTYCKARNIDINGLDVDHTENAGPSPHPIYIDEVIRYNVVHCKDIRIGDTEEDKLKNGEKWMFRRFFSALVETLDMAQIGQYDEELYPHEIYTERDWERDNWERDYRRFH